MALKKKIRVPCFEKCFPENTFWWYFYSSNFFRKIVFSRNFFAWKFFLKNFLSRYFISKNFFREFFFPRNFCSKTFFGEIFFPEIFFPNFFIHFHSILFEKWKVNERMDNHSIPSPLLPSPFYYFMYSIPNSFYSFEVNATL